MRNPESILTKRPRPEYEKDFGHQIEGVVEDFINDRVPGIHCEHATESEDLTQATDTWLILEGNDKHLPVQITMTSSDEMLRRKEKRGPILIHVPKWAAKEAWQSYSSTLGNEEGTKFSYQFLPEKAQKLIIEELMSHPDIKRYMLSQATRLYYNREN